MSARPKYFWDRQGAQAPALNVVQSAGAANQGATTPNTLPSFTFGVAPTVGNLIVAILFCNDLDTAPAHVPATSAGWTLLDISSAVGTFAELEYVAVYGRYVQAGDAALQSPNATLFGWYAMCAWEISGIAGSFVGDYAQSKRGPNVPPFSAAASVTTAFNTLHTADLTLGAIWGYSGGSTNGGIAMSVSGQTNDQNVIGLSKFACCSWHQTFANAGDLVPAYTGTYVAGVQGGSWGIVELK